MFLHVSVNLSTTETLHRGGVGQTPLSDTTGYCQQAGGTHPTGMHSCDSIRKGWRRDKGTVTLRVNRALQFIYACARYYFNVCACVCVCVCVQTLPVNKTSGVNRPLTVVDFDDVYRGEGRSGRCQGRRGVSYRPWIHDRYLTALHYTTNNYSTYNHDDDDVPDLCALGGTQPGCTGHEGDATPAAGEITGETTRRGETWRFVGKFSPPIILWIYFLLSPLYFGFGHLNCILF